MEYEYVQLQKDKYGSLPANGSLEQLWRTFVWLVNIKTSKLLFYTLTALEKKKHSRKLMPSHQNAYLSANSDEPVPWMLCL